MHGNGGTVKTHILGPAEVGKGLYRHSLADAVGQNGLLVLCGLLLEELHGRHGNDSYLVALLCKLCLSIQCETHLGAGGDEDILTGLLRILQHIGALQCQLAVRTYLRQILTGQHQCGRGTGGGQCGIPGRLGLCPVAGAEYPEVRDGAEHAELLDGLVGRSVLADTDGIMGQHEDLRQLHQSGESRHRLQIVAEDEEGADIGPETAVQQHAVGDTGHGQFTHAEVEISALRALR